MTGPSDRERDASTGAPGGLLPRLGARAIDSIILAIIGAILGLMVDYGSVWLVIEAVIVFAYFVLLDVSYGTTPGKQLLGLRVTGPHGGKPTKQQAGIREAFTLVGAIPFIGPLLSLGAWIVIGVTINSSPSNLGKHDELAGGTRVVKA